MPKRKPEARRLSRRPARGAEEAAAATSKDEEEAKELREDAAPNQMMNVDFVKGRDTGRMSVCNERLTKRNMMHQVDQLTRLSVGVKTLAIVRWAEYI